MLDASARLLRLLTLLQGRDAWTGADLSARLEVTPRTLRRDVERLRRLGYPVDSTSGVAGGYRLGEGASLPPLHLDEEEATAVFVGLHTAAGTEVTGADTAALRALTKLEGVLPGRLKRRLTTLRSAVLRLSDHAPTFSLADVSLLATACSERLVTRFAYAGQGGTAAAEAREVEPHRLVRVGQRWYLVAWDRAKREWRTFRLDRLGKPQTDKARFAARRPPADDLVRYVTESLSQSPYPHRARFLLHSPAAPLRARVTAYEGTLEEVSANRCILTTGARTLEALVVFATLFDVEFEILEPPELAVVARTLAAKLARVAMVKAATGTGSRVRPTAAGRRD